VRFLEMPEIFETKIILKISVLYWLKFLLLIRITDSARSHEIISVRLYMMDFFLLEQGLIV